MAVAAANAVERPVAWPAVAAVAAIAVAVVGFAFAPAAAVA